VPVLPLVRTMLLPLSAQILALLVGAALTAVALTYFGAALNAVQSEPEVSYLKPVIEAGVVSFAAVRASSTFTVSIALLCAFCMLPAA
jgi:hypothetical protein